MLPNQQSICDFLFSNILIEGKLENMLMRFTLIVDLFTPY